MNDQCFKVALCCHFLDVEIKIASLHPPISFESNGVKMAVMECTIFDQEQRV